MFNHRFNVRPAFYMDPASLSRRFVLCGVMHLVLLPFLLFFVTLHFGLRNAYHWKNTMQYLGPKDWSLSAKWMFREFNEYQHHFDQRLAPSYRAADQYLKLFGESEVVATAGQILVFVGGSLGAVLFCFAAINDAILLHVKIADWNLLWYAGVVGGLYSAGKAMIPTPDAQPTPSRNLIEESNAALEHIASFTHHFPSIWKGRGADATTRSTISSMYTFKAQLFLSEVVSLITAPYILCVSLPRCSTAICEFVFAARSTISGAGEVCGYATFDFDRFSDDKWEGGMGMHTEPTSGSLTASILETGSAMEALQSNPTPKAFHGKMEHSFFSFRVS